MGDYMNDMHRRLESDKEMKRFRRKEKIMKVIYAFFRSVATIVTRSVLLVLSVIGAISIYTHFVPYNDDRTFMVNLLPAVFIILLTAHVFMCSYLKRKNK